MPVTDTTRTAILTEAARIRGLDEEANRTYEGWRGVHWWARVATLTPSQVRVTLDDLTRDGHLERGVFSGHEAWRIREVQG